MKELGTEQRHDAIMSLKCSDCGTEWEEHFSLPMNLTVFVNKTKACACPNCGGKKALMQPRGDFWQDDEVKQ